MPTPHADRDACPRSAAHADRDTCPHPAAQAHSDAAGERRDRLALRLATSSAGSARADFSPLNSVHSSGGGDTPDVDLARRYLGSPATVRAEAVAAWGAPPQRGVSFADEGAAPAPSPGPAALPAAAAAPPPSTVRE
jgi:hypothetical protein